MRFQAVPGRKYRPKRFEALETPETPETFMSVVNQVNRGKSKGVLECLLCTERDSAEDIARGVLFLVADDADFITGTTLSINGGQHMY